MNLNIWVFRSLKAKMRDSTHPLSDLGPATAQVGRKQVAEVTRVDGAAVG
ncbi:hypothetical protein V6Z11_D11G181200 [Gossypium hirsutum]